MTFCHILCMECLFYASSNNQPACWDSTYLDTTFPWWKYPGEIAVCAYRSLLQDLLGRSVNESIRNSPFDILHPIALQDCTRSASLSLQCSALQFPKKLVLIFLNDFHAAFSTILSWSSDFMSCIHPVLFEIQQIPLLLFQHH